MAGMKMPMRKRTCMTVLALILISAAAFAIWNWQRELDLTGDEPPFNSIALPLRSVRGDIYMDGGSVWVGVEDHKGAVYDFVFPIDNKTEDYPKAFHGIKRPSDPTGVPLADPARARQIALHWLRHVERRDDGIDRALDYLSGGNRPIQRRLEELVPRAFFE